MKGGRGRLRVRTFQAALEQAEQQFRAAASVSYDSRALNLFYGLSQAGRAIAAAGPLGADDWELRGHGLRCPLSGSPIEDIMVLEVERKGRKPESFQRVSAVLGSPVPDRAVTLGEVWPLLYENTVHGRTAELHVPLEVRLGQRMEIRDHCVDTADVLLPPALKATPLTERPALSDFLARYPALDGWKPTDPRGSPVTWPAPEHALGLLWELTEQQTGSRHVAGDRLTLYRGQWAAFPTLDGGDRSLHPLMAWWMVLYALSMLTRYEPASWTHLIDIDASDSATALEFVLDVALDAVPDLVDEALDTTSIV